LLVAAACNTTIGPKHVHPHSHRHPAAVHMRRAGDEGNAIAAVLGYTQIATTERCCRHVDLAGKRKAFAANPSAVECARSRLAQPGSWRLSKRR
jgi:site-specific recombinase XerD